MLERTYSAWVRLSHGVFGAGTARPQLRRRNIQHPTLNGIVYSHIRTDPRDRLPGLDLNNPVSAAGWTRLKFEIIHPASAVNSACISSYDRCVAETSDCIAHYC